MFKFNPLTGKLDLVRKVSNFVPYTGATSNVDLGVHNLTVDTNTLFVDSVNHRVGIGTTAPTANLQVAQSTAGAGTVSNLAGGTTVTGAGTQFTNTFKVGDTITLPSGGVPQTVAISAIASDTSMTTAAITAANTTVAYTLVGGTRFSVLGNGNVGIGTTSPGAKLQVNGDASAITTIFRANATTPGDLTQWQNSVGAVLAKITKDGYANLGNYNISSTIGHVSGGPYLTSDTTRWLLFTNAATNKGLVVQGYAGQSANLFEWQNSNNVGLGAITGSGNVGIGTTGPASKLHIGVAPTASANYGTLSIGGGAFDGVTAGKFVGSASGTSLAVNEVTGYAGNLIDAQVGGVSRFSVDNLGGITHYRTITAGGTTGNQIINKPSGTVNIAAAGTTVTVTNSLVNASSIIYVVLRTNDATATIKNVVPAAGSFVINLGAAATAEVSIGFLVTN